MVISLFSLIIQRKQRIMLNTIKDGISTLFRVISFCIKLTYSTSKKYFILHLLVDIVAAVVPFVGIFFTSKIIDTLANNYGSADGFSGKAAKAFVVFLDSEIMSSFILLEYR